MAEIWVIWCWVPNPERECYDDPEEIDRAFCRADACDVAQELRGRWPGHLFGVLPAGRQAKPAMWGGGA